MPESFEYNQKKGYISVLSVGEITADDLESSLAKLQSVITETNCHRVFVDAQGETSLPSIVELYEFAEDLPQGVRIAVLKVELNSMDLKLVESVANRRGKRVKIFDNRESGMNWLLAT